MPLCTDIVSGLPLLLDPTIADRKASAEAQCDYLKDASIFGPCHSIEVNQVQVHLFFYILSLPVSIVIYSFPAVAILSV